MLRARSTVYFSLTVIVLAGAVAAYLGPGSGGTGSGASREDAGKPAAGRPDEPEAALQLSAEEMRRAGIKVERLEPVEFSETLAAFGTVGPNRNAFARVTPPVPGRLVKIDVDLGAQVTANATLAVLESPELADLRSTWLQNKTELDIAQISAERAHKLFVDKSMAQKDVQRAQADYERARTALAAVDAKLASLGVTAAAPSGTPAAYLVVTAPISGTVVERTAVLGEYAQAYQPLFTVADLSTVWVETNLFDRDLAVVTIGAPAVVTVSAYPDRRFAGKVAYVGNILDKDTRTAVARVEVANPDHRLKPGLFADVAIETGARRSALRVPEDAVVLLQGQMTAFLAHDDGFEPRPVELGERSGGMVVVKSGLLAGDQVVVSGAYALKARLLKSQIGDSH